MADPSPPPTSALVIPPEVQATFGPMLTLIHGSESMNNEERQYWINILPIMTPEQLKNLEDILTSEKKQLAAIDAKYSTAGTTAPDAARIQSMEQKIREQKQKRRQTEEGDLRNETSKEEEILSQIQSL